MSTETIIQITEEQLRRIVREEVQRALLSYPNAIRPQPYWPYWPYWPYEPNVTCGGVGAACVISEPGLSSPRSKPEPRQ